MAAVYPKQYYRRKVKQAFRQLPREELRKRSRKLVQQLIQTSCFQQAKVIMGYLPLADEVDISRIFLEQKEFCLPKLEHDLIVPVGVNTGRRVKVNRIDLVIVPGRAFTREGIRIGRGRGIYDRFLPTLAPATVTLSLAFRFQIFSRLPCQPHDVAVQQIITED